MLFKSDGSSKTQTITHSPLTYTPSSRKWSIFRIDVKIIRQRGHLTSENKPEPKDEQLCRHARSNTMTEFECFSSAHCLGILETLLERLRL